MMSFVWSVWAIAHRTDDLRDKLTICCGIRFILTASDALNESSIIKTLKALMVYKPLRRLTTA